MVEIIIVRETRTERMERILQSLIAPVPSTKGMGPADRAARLHAEMERRIALAKEALRYGHWKDGEWESES